MSSNDEWNKAIAECVREFDNNPELRDVWEKEDAEYLQDHAGDRKLSRMVATRPEGAFVDPVRGIHPPATVLERIRKAKQRLDDVSANADRMREQAKSAAEKEDSKGEKQKALNEVSKRFDSGTPELKGSVDELEDAQTEAGVYALSLRSPFIIRDDLTRDSRKADAEEFSLFDTVLYLTMNYPSQTRRALHDARTADERRRIIDSGRETCRNVLTKSDDVSQPSRFTIAKEGELVVYDGVPYPINGDDRWRDIHALICGEFIELQRGFPARFAQGKAKEFRKKATIPEGKGRNGTRRYKLVL